MKANRTWKIRFGLMLAAAAVMVALTSVAAWASPKIKNIDYEGKGKVEVEFKTKVRYGNLKVTAHDASGKKYKTRITDRDADDLNFKILGYKKGKKYTFKISGIRKKSETAYSSVKGTVKIPKTVNGLTLKEADYDAHDRELSIEFIERVQWKNPTVSVKAGGKEYVRKIEETSRNEIEVKVNKLTAGKTYSFTVTGVRKKGTSEYVTVTGTFKA